MQSCFRNKLPNKERNSSARSMNGNLQCGELRHIAEGERSQRADAVVAQIPAQMQTHGQRTWINKQQNHLHICMHGVLGVLVQGQTRATYTSDSCFRAASSLGTDVSMFPSKYLKGNGTGCYTQRQYANIESR